ncbi:BglG family transcription antiterminator [Clostridium sp.]|uniref:BglG family transcription antiterminator n=1 Tax=Clostridium sp. TaxID=1506 RepID=UPI003F3D3707
MIANLRQEKILKILLESNKVLTGKTLCTSIGVSSRTIRSDVKELNYILEPKGAIIYSEKGKGYEINIQNEEMFKSFLNELEDKDKDINLSIDERIDYIISKLAINNIKHTEGITQMDLADELFISISSLKNNIKIAKDKLAEFNLDIDKISNKGIGLSGDEESLRQYLNKLWNGENIFFEKDFNIIVSNLLGENSLSKIKKILVGKLEDFNIKLSDIALKDVLSYIVITLVRIKKGFTLSNNQKMDFYSVSDHKLSLAKNLIKDLDNEFNIFISENEIFYLAKHIASSSVIIRNNICNEYISREVDDEIYNITNLILDALIEKFNVDFSKDNTLKEFLLIHLQSAINRCRYGIKLENCMIKTIKNNYLLAFEMGVLLNDILKESLNMDLGEDEIGFISLHFAAALERLKEKQERIKKAIVVCTTGVGTSLLLKIKIQKHFKDKIKIIDTIPWYDFKEELLNNIDIVLSTVPLELKSKKVVFIKNLLDFNDIKNIEKNLKSFNLDQNGLINKFNRELFINKLDLNDKDQVLEFMSNKLINLNYIDNEVKDSILERENLYPTEIGNLVAIPHTMHSNLNRSSIEIAILKKPIIWEKEKVQLVILISICKDDQIKFKDTLGELYKSILDIDKVLSIINNGSYDNFIKIIKNN